ncbi:MAG: S8 family serine peptidase, partial [Bdellovibrionales bacterium]|nr:S8 family serine peptidase [Bdellovibrionales bacterium]
MTDSGLIGDFLSDPLKKLDELNSQFMDRLLPKVKSDPRLSGTLFRNFGRDSLHVLGALILSKKSATYMEEYQNAMDTRIAIDPDSYVSGSNYLKVTLREGGPAVKRMLFEGPWITTSVSIGLPYFMGKIQISQIKGFDVFMEILDREFSEFETETQFSNQFLEPYFKYKYSLLGGGTFKTPWDRYQSYISDLYDSWVFFDRRGANDDPFVGLSLLSCAYLNNQDYAVIANPLSSPENRESVIKSTLNQAFDLGIEAARIRLTDKEGTPDSRRDAKKQIESVGKYRNWIFTVLEDRGFENIQCDRDRYYRSEYKYSQEYKDYAFDIKSPYHSKKSEGNSHASHVAGIILSQEENARILPAKVVTETRFTTEQLDEKTKSEFWSEFEVWARSPLISGAIVELMEDDIDTSSSTNDSELATKNVDPYIEELKDAFVYVFAGNKLDYYFIPEVAAAIRYYGDQRVKLVNISLGTKFEKARQSTRVEKDATIEDRMLFLTYEFFKYKIAKVTQDYAANTLFIIASGNDGVWLDSKTKSGIPCDLSSAWLSPYAKKSKATLPQNTLNNVLCVGSIDSEDDISAF